MEAFFEYVRNITYYLVFISLIGVLTPEGRYKKYIALITGIILIGIVLKPLAGLTGSNPVPLTELFAQSFPMPDGNAETYGSDEAREYEYQQYRQIQAVFNDELCAQIKSLLQQGGYNAIDVAVETSEDFSRITSVRVSVQEGADTAENNGNSARPFIYIEPVTPVNITAITGANVSGGIVPENDVKAAEEDEITAEIKKMIANFYNMPMENIHVVRFENKQ